MVKLLFSMIVLVASLVACASTVDTISVFSKSMRKDIRCVTILPDSYDDAKREFPVIYLLHGYSGNYASWLICAPQILTRVDEMQSIFICPDGGYRSWYLDSPIDTMFKYETFIARELVAFVDTSYRTMADRGHRAITGLSMGGHGGLYLGCRHKDIFGAAGSTSGGVDLRQFTASWDLKEMILGDTTCCRKNWEDCSVINVVDGLNNNDLAIIIDCGVDDFFIGVNRDLHEKLLAMKIDHDYIERAGAHTSAYWKSSIDYQLLFFYKYFNSK